MPQDTQPPIADYAIISDMHSCALVSRAGSIDWLCFPRFDSTSAFARLLDWHKGGFFQIEPLGVQSVSRQYLPGTNILETTFQTGSGRATLTDLMPVHPHSRPTVPREVGSLQQVIRVLECTSGSVAFTARCQPRFDYGSITPHVQAEDQCTAFVHGGPDALSVYFSNPFTEEDGGLSSGGTLRKGERFCSSATYQAGFHPEPQVLDDQTIEQRFEETARFWRDWSQGCTYRGEYEADVLRSALTLKALTYAPSGALLAAPTTSLPEAIGGPRNWDYRYTWIRDATFALYALSIIGFQKEAEAFKDWLEWTTTGRAADMQILYGLGGERRLTEIEIPELEGYRGSKPVRIGNGAYRQFQLDIYGELLDSAHLYRKFGGRVDPDYWHYLCEVVEFALANWREPDDGIWETRSGRRHFVHSKVMCWVAADRAIRAAEALDLPADIDRWRTARAEIKADVLAKGYDAEREAFVQAYDSDLLDASNLMIPLVGFLGVTDDRMRSTIATIKKQLVSPQGLVYRYKGFNDGVEGGEGTFAICSYWLADNLILLGETEQARGLFEQLLALSNDVGLFSEQIDGQTGELLGNFPQAFSHLGLINTAVQLAKGEDHRQRTKKASAAEKSRRRS
jgi:GH15 family glucan-1,4-alpha-glucosidase